MGFGDRSDAELIELARAGWAPAFAVLVHRYAPLVHAVVAPTTRDPRGAVVEVFTSAMRELWYRDPASPVAPWLLGLAGARRAPANPRPLRAEELDAIWIQLHRRWPTGRAVRWHLPWQRVGTVAGLVALAAVVPAVVLGTDDTSPDEELAEVRAVPVDEEPAEEEPSEEPAEVQEDLTFPTASEEEPAPDPLPSASDEDGAGSGTGETHDGEAGEAETGDGSESDGEPEGEPDDPPDEPDDGDDEPDPGEQPDDDGLIGELVGGDDGADDASDESASDEGTADESASDDGSGTD